MIKVASAEKYNVDARLVTHKAISGFSDRARSTFVQKKPRGFGASASQRGNFRSAVRWRNSAVRRSGFEKMLRTANISNVPIRLATVPGNTCVRAFWCIM